MKTKFTTATSFAIMFLMSCGGPKKVVVDYEDVMVQATQASREITRIVKNDLETELFPVVSPDGKKLLFSVRSNQKSVAEKQSFSLGRIQNVNYYEKQKWGIKLIEIGKPGVISVYEDYAYRPNWFANSSGFLYSYTRGKKPLITKSSLQNPGITFLSSNPFGDDDKSAHYIYGNSKVLFETTMGDVSHICLSDSLGLNFTILTEGEYPGWNPIEEKIVYTKKVGKEYQIFTYNLKSGQVTQITNGEDQNTAPRWSPNFKYIVFASDRDNDKAHIYVMKSDGSSVTQLTTGDYQESTPFWGADGYIYFVSNAGFKKTKDNLFNNTDLWKLKPILNF